MLADPQSITIAGATVSLPRTGEIGNQADYTAGDLTRNLRITQKVGKDVRRTTASLQSHKITADALTAVNRRVTSTVSVTVTSPIDGFSVQELADELTGLATLLTASSATVAKRILAGEK